MNINNTMDNIEDIRKKANQKGEWASNPMSHPNFIYRPTSGAPKVSAEYARSGSDNLQSQLTPEQNKIFEGLKNFYKQGRSEGKALGVEQSKDITIQPQKPSMEQQPTNSTEDIASRLMNMNKSKVANNMNSMRLKFGQ